MSLDRDLLVRYLRQRRQLGEREAFLDGLTAAEAREMLRRPPAPPTVPSPRPDASATVAAEAVEGNAVAADTVAADAARAVAHDGPEAGSALAGANARGEGQRTAEALRVLGAQAADCTRCRLHEGRRNVVFGVGNPAADLVVVGEAPGFEEDRTGRPFVGPAGKLLDLMLLSIGFPRDDVYICNVLKCRPPQNRDPQRDEVEACSEYLHRQLDLIAPRVLLAVGRFAAQTLTATDVSIGRLRGRVHEYRGTPLVATYHPAFLLRSPQWTRAAWQDLQLLREVLDA